MKPVRYSLNNWNYTAYIYNTINFHIKDYDDDNLVTTGANWEFEAPHAAILDVNFMLLNQSAAWTNGNYTFVRVLRDIGAGYVVYTYPERFHMESFENAYYVPVRGKFHIEVDTGDKIRLQLYRYHGSGQIYLHNDSRWNYICIKELKS